MRIGKRISFSLDGVWAEWCFSLTRCRSGSTIFVLAFNSLGSKVERPFYLNPRRGVNTNFWLFLQGGFICRGHRPCIQS